MNLFELFLLMLLGNFTTAWDLLGYLSKRKDGSFHREGDSSLEPA